MKGWSRMKTGERPPTATRERRTVSIAAAITGLVLIAVVATLVWGRPLFHGAAAGAHATPTARAMATATAAPTATATPNLTPLAPTGESVIVGQVGAARQVNPESSAPSGPPPLLTLVQRQTLSQPRDWRAGLTQSGQPPNLGAPHVSASPVGGPSPAGVIVDHARVSFEAQDSATNAALTPTGTAAAPTVSLCVGMTAEMEMTSAAATFYDRAGHALSNLVSLDALLGEPVTFIAPEGHTILSWPADARCTYDVPSHSWFAVATVMGLDLTTSTLYGRTHLDLATNQTDDPRTSWTVYQLDTTNDGANGTPHEQGCACVSDQPLLGVDGTAIYLSTNEFGLSGGFLGARIYALDKAAIVGHSQQVHLAQFTHLALGGALAASVQPATLVGDPGAEFFLSALDPAGSMDNRIGLWAMTNEGALSQGMAPHLASVLVGSETYGRPPAGGTAQPGVTTLLSAGDDRMQQVEYRNGKLYSALETVALPSGDGTPRAGLAWFILQPQLGNGGSVNGTMLRQDYMAAQGSDLLAPVLAVAWDDDMEISATVVGAGHYPTAVYTTTHPRAFSPFGSLNIIGPGGQPGEQAGCGSGSANAPCPWFAASSTAWDATNLNGEAVMWMATGFAPSGLAAFSTQVFAVGPI